MWTIRIRELHDDEHTEREYCSFDLLARVRCRPEKPVFLVVSARHHANSVMFSSFKFFAAALFYTRCCMINVTLLNIVLTFSFELGLLAFALCFRH